MTTEVATGSTSLKEKGRSIQQARQFQDVVDGARINQVDLESLPHHPDQHRRLILLTLLPILDDVNERILSAVNAPQTSISVFNAPFQEERTAAAADRPSITAASEI